MAFQQVYNGLLDGIASTFPYPVSNAFLISIGSPLPWCKYKISLIGNVDGIPGVELSKEFGSIRGFGAAMVIVPITYLNFGRVTDFKVELLPKFDLVINPVVSVFNGDPEEMIYNPASVEELLSASKITDESSVSISNIGNNPVAIIKSANARRSGGLINSEINGTIYIGFGAAPAKKPTSALSKGGYMDIPVGFTGEIFVDWNGTQVASTAPTTQARQVHIVEFLRA
jgi:hypothetical protein